MWKSGKQEKAGAGGFKSAHRGRTDGFGFLTFLISTLKIKNSPK